MLSRTLLGTARRVPVKSQLIRSGNRTYSSAETNLHGAQDNAFNRERAAVKQHAADSSGLWRKLSIYAVVPALLLAGANAYKLWHEHWEHESHRPPPSERPQYEYLNLRAKAFPWGNGDKTLFWNDEINYKAANDE
ncbi:cytochrome c oxidase subunit VIa [Trichodelitschia bisporula]|uniref:Cytochrome c oxidase subunit 13, mitochondrial n=1 Tax=Trichodelitschia bisporula TaxID=703511 RepID=A0A6G1HND0_9PEZI|nr:cytochrome c oxidase subunit VIa [Trichodelitschia bisporula]